MNDEQDKRLKKIDDDIDGLYTFILFCFIFSHLTIAIIISVMLCRGE